MLVASGPELSELLARARGVGAGMAASKERRTDLVEQLTRQSILMESVGAKLDASMASALELTPGLKAALEESATASSDAVIDAQGEIVKLTGRAAGLAAPEHDRRRLLRRADAAASTPSTAWRPGSGLRSSRC